MIIIIKKTLNLNNNLYVLNRNDMIKIKSNLNIINTIDYLNYLRKIYKNVNVYMKC